MRPDEVTLGEAARHLCRRLGRPETDIQAARSGSGSVFQGREYLIVVGEAPDGRTIRMACRHDRPHHVITWRELTP